jgi:hypothetical protein
MIRLLLFALLLISPAYAQGSSIRVVENGRVIIEITTDGPIGNTPRNIRKVIRGYKRIYRNPRIIRKIMILQKKLHI